MPCIPFDLFISYFPRIASNFKIESEETPSPDVTIALPSAVEQEHILEIGNPKITSFKMDFMFFINKCMPFMLSIRDVVIPHTL